MAVATAIAVAGLAVAATGTYMSYKNGQAAAKQNAIVNKAQREQNDLQAARQRRNTVRQARMAYAQSQQAATNQGVSGSSASLGGLSSIVSQQNSELSFLDRYNFLSDTASQALGKAYQYEQKAQTWSNVADVGMTAFNSSDRIASVFRPKGGR